MPVFEYRCKRCGRRTTKLFKTLAAVATPPCAHCGSRRMERLYSRITVLKGGGASDDRDAGDLRGMDEVASGVESGDPRSLARMARRMSDEMGEGIPPEYDGMLRRMEAGDMPSDEEFGAVEPDAAGGEVDEGE
ncbi:MAG: zinc ribbon domain-containing protein [Actinobacteria bacterium]|nr:zinc ribbon domain-containing protein [Actinomycetota bacterium]